MRLARYRLDNDRRISYDKILAVIVLLEEKIWKEQRVYVV
jgi:hypothetical protein